MLYVRFSMKREKAPRQALPPSRSGAMERRTLAGAYGVAHKNLYLSISGTSVKYNSDLQGLFRHTALHFPTAFSS
jgi:hypothetical protein